MKDFLQAMQSLIDLGLSLANLITSGSSILLNAQKVDTWIDYKLWSILVTVSLFLVARTIQIIGSYLTARQQRRKLTVALYTEISFNVRYLNAYNISIAQTNEICMRIASFTPVLLQTENHDVLMRGQASELGLLPTPIVQKAVAFYARLREADASVTSVNSTQFVGISDQGRFNTVYSAFSATRKARNLGIQIIRELRNENGSWLLCRKLPRSVKWTARSARLVRHANNVWANPWTRVPARFLVWAGVPDLFRAIGLKAKTRATQAMDRNFNEPRLAQNSNGRGII